MRDSISALVTLFSSTLGPLTVLSNFTVGATDRCGCATGPRAVSMVISVTYLGRIGASMSSNKTCSNNTRGESSKEYWVYEGCGNRTYTFAKLKCVVLYENLVRESIRDAFTQGHREKKLQY